MKAGRTVTQLVQIQPNCFHHNHYRYFSRRIQPRSQKYRNNTRDLVSDTERSELIAQSKIEDSQLYFQSILNTRKKIANITETNPIKPIKQLSDEYKQSMQENALVWQKKKDKINKQNNLLDLDRIINDSKLLQMKLPSPELQHYLDACRIATLLRLDPVKDKELIALKKRIQWILMKHRLSACPPLDFFLKHRYVDHSSEFS